ncbi:MAG: sigma 54-interacting transcriptional regulator [Bryobacteraceae bacterium]
MGDRGIPDTSPAVKTGGLADSQKLAAILRVCQRMNSERDVNALLDLVVVEATRLLDCERASIFLFTPTREELVSRVALGSEQTIRVRAGVGIAGAVASSGEVIVVNDAYGDPRFFQGVDNTSGYRTRNMLALPMIAADGESIGAFEVLNKRVGPYTSEDLEIGLSLAANAALAIQNAQMISELRRHRAVLETENRNLLRELGGRLPAQSLLGLSPQIEALRAMIERVSDADVTVFITGESGTGKDLVARSIHFASPRARGPFVALNCAALPETLVETELFGVEKGVATGVERRIGKFESAHGGTLFLDEIGDLSPTAQAKILRVLQERTVERIGSRNPVPIDVRIVAATNKDVESAIARGQFREDLYYRLNVVRLRTPPLREIVADIALLASYFLGEAAREMKRPPLELSPQTLAVISAYPWPGNVRQLQNEMRRATVCARGSMIEPSDLSEALQATTRDTAAAPPPPARGPARDLQDEVEELEKQRIREALAGCGYNQVRTARRLGLSRQGLINKLKRYSIALPGGGEHAAQETAETEPNGEDNATP